MIKSKHVADFDCLEDMVHYQNTKNQFEEDLHELESELRDLKYQITNTLKRYHRFLLNHSKSKTRSRQKRMKVEAATTNLKIESSQNQKLNKAKIDSAKLSLLLSTSFDASERNLLDHLQKRLKHDSIPECRYDFR